MATSFDLVDVVPRRWREILKQEYALAMFILSLLLGACS